MNNRECMDCSVSITERHHSTLRCRNCQRKNANKLKRKARKKPARRAQIKAAAKEYRRKNKDKRREYARATYTSSYRRKRYLMDKESILVQETKGRENLTDDYIRRLLVCNRHTTKCPLKVADISLELIKIKRKEVILKRAIGLYGYPLKTKQHEK